MRPLPDRAACDALLAVARRCADAARGPALRHFRNAALTAEDKAPDGRFDPVTCADREAEAAIRAVLAAERPQDAVLGEEHGTRPGRSGITWVVDPIDGTRGYIAGTPTWGVLIAAHAGAAPFLGIIDQPFTGERFWGARDGTGPRAMWERGAERRPLAVRPCAGLADAVLFSTFPEIGSPVERDGFAAVAAQTRLTRYGMDCYAYALLAMGCIDLVIEAGLHAYDIQAPLAVIEAAGGVVTDWRGGPCHAGGRILAAGDARTHRAAVALLSQVA